MTLGNPTITCLRNALVATALISVLTAPALLAAERPARPNFILIFTDDQGYADLGIQGHPYIRTPNIDRMAREGVRFTDFYAQPFCGPSRAALLTGTYPSRNSLMFNHIPRARTGIHPNEITVAELLKDRGYSTAMLGKWHLGDAPRFLPTRNGFDSYYGVPYSSDMWPYHPKIIRRPDEDERMQYTRERTAYTGYAQSEETYPVDWFPPLPLIENEEVIELNPKQELLTQAYTDRAVDYIKSHREDPFFLYIAHSMPHVPLFRSREFRDQSMRGLYGDVIEEIDHHVGRILDTLKSTGLDEKTLVIFTSDNGPWVGYGIDAGSAGMLRGSKGTLFEGGIRVPAIMRWPGQIPEGLVTSEVASNMDVFPTLAKLAGGAPPADRTIDGRDLWPLMTDPAAKSPHEALYFYEGGFRYKAEDGPPKNDPKLKAVRSGPWKLYVGTQPGEEPDSLNVVATELFNLHYDVSEKYPLTDKHPEVIERLVKQAKRFNDALRKSTRPLGRLAD